MISIRLFGGLELRGPAGRPPLPTQSSQNLLAFLALDAGRLYHRDVLAGTLWGDRPDRSARKALRNGLWRLRCALEPETADEGRFLSVDGQRVGLVGDVRVDTGEFDDLLAGVGAHAGEELTSGQAEALRRAVDLYRGDLLDGVYDDWTLAPRESLRLAFLTALERLFVHHRVIGDFHTAVAFGRRLLRHDPLRERAHRELMVCHWTMGDRPLALRQYQVCEKVLREEFDIDPMDETQALHGRIRSGAPPPSPTRDAPDDAVDPSLAVAVSDLYALAGRLERIRAGAVASRPGPA